MQATTSQSARPIRKDPTIQRTRLPRPTRSIANFSSLAATEPRKGDGVSTGRPHPAAVVRRDQAAPTDLRRPHVGNNRAGVAATYKSNQQGALTPPHPLKHRRTVSFATLRQPSGAPTLVRSNQRLGEATRGFQTVRGAATGGDPHKVNPTKTQTGAKEKEEMLPLRAANSLINRTPIQTRLPAAKLVSDSPTMPRLFGRSSMGRYSELLKDLDLSFELDISPESTTNYYAPPVSGEDNRREDVQDSRMEAELAELKEALEEVRARRDEAKRLALAEVRRRKEAEQVARKAAVRASLIAWEEVEREAERAIEEAESLKGVLAMMLAQGKSNLRSKC